MRYFRGILIGLLLVSGIALLTRPPRNTEKAPADRTVIHYWEQWSGIEAEQMKQIVDQFNATVGAEKKIWVSYLSMTAVDEKTLLATAAGAPPDVAGLTEQKLRQFASLGALEPLGGLATAHGIHPSDYKPVYWQMCCHDGTLYALPSTPNDIALHYNKAEFAQAGLPPDQPPKTIAELDRMAQRLETRDASGNLTRAGYLPQEPGWYLANTPVWFGGQLYDPAMRKLTLLDPPVVQACRWLQSYTQRLGAMTVAQYRSNFGKDTFDSANSPFFTGLLAMEQEGPWKANYIAKLKPEMSNIHGYTPQVLATLTRQQRRDNCSWAAAPFPAVDASMNPVTYAGSDILVIPRGGRHVSQAFEFIAFVNRQDVMERLVSMHCKNSPLATVSAGYIQNHPNPYIEVFEALAASPNARTLPDLAVWPEVKSELDNAIDRICLGDVSVEQALGAAQMRGQALIDRFFARQDQRQRRLS